MKTLLENAAGDRDDLGLFTDSDNAGARAQELSGLAAASTKSGNHAGAASTHDRAARMHGKAAELMDAAGRGSEAKAHRTAAKTHKRFAAIHAKGAEQQTPTHAEGKVATVELEAVLENETLDEDGWALIAPFGEHRKTRLVKRNGQIEEQRFIQVLDNAAADQLMSKENSLFRKIRRALIGIPVYKGHPDLAEHAPETLGNGKEKKEVIGLIDQVRKGARGIEAHFSLTPAGAAAVENEGCKYPSVLWLVLPEGERDGAILARPFKLLSAGLTAYPNISGVDSLSNERPAGQNQENQTKEPDMKLLAGWLIANGAVLANTEQPTETQVLEAFQKLHTSKAGEVVTLGNEKTTMTGKITTLETAKAAAETKATEAATTLANETTARKAERKGRAEMTVDLAIHRGKLSIAQREAQVTALENAKDFEEAAKTLLGSATKHKTTGAESTESGKVLANEENGDARHEYDTHLANEMKNTGDPVKAHSNVMKKNPGLAEKLKARK